MHGIDVGMNSNKKHVIFLLKLGASIWSFVVASVVSIVQSNDQAQLSYRNTMVYECRFYAF